MAFYKFVLKYIYRRKYGTRKLFFLFKEYVNYSQVKRELEFMSAMVFQFLHEFRLSE